MRLLKKWIAHQISEIGSDSSLLIYGFFLSFTHVLTFFFWHNITVIHQTLVKSAHAICWPFIPLCESFRLPAPLLAEVLLFAYLNLSVITAFLFLYGTFLKMQRHKKARKHYTVPLAYAGFFMLTLLKLYMFFMDFRMMGNYHYMPFVVSFGFLFLRGKKYFIPWLLLCFYVFAGLLKISNQDWLTGLAFPTQLDFPLFFNEDVQQWLCFYVVCLELMGAWFLIPKSGTQPKGIAFMPHQKKSYFRDTYPSLRKMINVRNLFLMQFVIFHIMSYFIVGWFYPFMMLCLLTIFPLSSFFDSQSQVYYPPNTPIGVGFFLFLSMIIMGNLLSVFIPGRAGLTGEGRLYGLNMYDAHTECDSQIFLKFYTEGSRERYQVIQGSFTGYQQYALRIHCDPYMGYNTVKKLCAYYKANPDFIDLDWFFYSKLRSDLKYTKTVSEKNVCAKNLKISSWKKNPWIHIQRI